MTSERQGRQSGCILVPLDGSSLAEASLSYVPLFCRSEGARIELMTVREAGDTRASEEDVKRYLTGRSAALWARYGVEASIEVEQGIPYLTIIEEARSEDVALIVISTHGHTGPAKWRLGGVTDKVVRDSRCPILTIGPSCPPGPERLRRVLLPLDGSELAEIAIPMVAGIAGRFGTIVELVRVIEPESPQRTDEEEASSYLETVARTFPEDVATKRTVLHGPAAQTLQEYAQSSSPDLLVMSSHGGHGFLSYALGNVTDRLLAGPVPLLIVRPGHLPRIKLLFPS